MGRMLTAVLLLTLPFWTSAVETPEGGTAGDGGAGGGAASEENPGEAEPRPPRGDIVYFKNGRKLAGVQVTVETLASIEVVPAPGVRSLVLPRSVISRIEYDNIKDASGNWLLDNAGDEYDKEVMEGREISPELHEKITAPLFAEEKHFEQEDFKKVLGILADECNLAIVFGEILSGLPVEERLWTVDIEPGASLLEVLQTDFSTSFPDIEWVYQFDKIGVYVRKSVPED